MNMFNELNDNEEIKVPSDLEAMVAARSTYRNRKQRVIAGGLSVLLVLLVSSVAYASLSNSGDTNLNTTDKNKSEKLNKIEDNITSTTFVDGTQSSVPNTVANENDDEDENEDRDSSISTEPNSDSAPTSRVTSTSTPTTNDDHGGDDSGDDNSGSGSDSSGSDHAEDDL